MGYNYSSPAEDVLIPRFGLIADGYMYRNCCGATEVLRSDVVASSFLYRTSHSTNTEKCSSDHCGLDWGRRTEHSKKYPPLPTAYKSLAMRRSCSGFDIHAIAQSSK